MISGVLGRGWVSSMPRNRHDESWRGGMTLPFFLEKSGFTGVNCRFRGISGRRVCVSCSIFFQLLRGNDWCRAQSFIEQKASGDCLCWSRAVFYRAKASVIIKLGLRCSIWFALDEWNLGHPWSVRISAGGMFELWWGYVHSVIHLDVIFVTSFLSLFRIANQTVNFLL